jgi:hypothetical protein
MHGATTAAYLGPETAQALQLQQLTAAFRLNICPCGNSVCAGNSHTRKYIQTSLAAKHCRNH